MTVDVGNVPFEKPPSWAKPLSRNVVTVGSGKYTYESTPSWPKRPPGGRAVTMVPGLAVDKRDRIYVYNRNPNNVYVFDRDGNFVSVWDNSLFSDFTAHSSHGFHIGQDDKAYLTDVRDHTVRKYTLDGELLLTLGTPGKLGNVNEPFRSPAAVTTSPSGEIFVADGYDNARIHKFSPEGKLLKSWGRPGQGPGEFNLPHGIWVDRNNHVWVADRENDRIQIFDTEGTFLKQLTGFSKPSVVYIDKEDTVYVPQIHIAQMNILNLEGKMLTRWGGDRRRILDYLSNLPGDTISYRDLFVDCLRAPGNFVDGHSCCVDSNGDLYVGECMGGGRITKYIRKR